LNLAEIEAYFLKVKLELVIGMLDLKHGFFQVRQRVLLLNIVVSTKLLNSVHQRQVWHATDILIGL